MCTRSNVPSGPPGLWRFIALGGSILPGCTGAGTRCTVEGQRGRCAEGRMVCSLPTLRCVQLNTPVAERCNGVDDNCNGLMDDGEDLCSVGYQCAINACRPRCGEGNACPQGLVCDTRLSVCVESTCASTSCPQESVCRNGTCVNRCEGVSCPSSQQCRAGLCRDVCEGISCGPNEVCVRPLGVCMTSCRCINCPYGYACAPDGVCIPDSCVGVTCPEGFLCQKGTCHDTCTPNPDFQLLCPFGERCVRGQCITDRGDHADAGPDAHDGDVMRADVGVVPLDAGARRSVTATGGCSCTSQTVANPREAYLWVTLCALHIASRRRRAQNSAARHT
jgi:hypothetical protein